MFLKEGMYMQITKILSSSNPEMIKVPRFDYKNRSHKFLDNEMLDIVKASKAPAIFSNEGIVFTQATEYLIKKLQELGLTFIK